MVRPAATSDKLPEMLRPLFCDGDFEQLRASEHHTFVVRRILFAGPWDAVSWLRRQIGNRAVRAWIEAHQGRGLSPPQLRFRQLVLGLVGWEQVKSDLWRWVKSFSSGM